MIAEFWSSATEVLYKQARDWSLDLVGSNSIHICSFPSMLFLVIDGNTKIWWSNLSISPKWYVRPQKYKRCGYLCGRPKSNSGDFAYDEIVSKLFHCCQTLWVTWCCHVISHIVEHQSIYQFLCSKPSLWSMLFSVGICRCNLKYNQLLLFFHCPHFFHCKRCCFGPISSNITGDNSCHKNYHIPRKIFLTW